MFYFTRDRAFTVSVEGDRRRSSKETGVIIPSPATHDAAAAANYAADDRQCVHQRPAKSDVTSPRRTLAACQPRRKSSDTW